MKEFELKIEYLPVDSLTPYEKNTRKHSPTDIEGIQMCRTPWEGETQCRQ